MRLLFKEPGRLRCETVPAGRPLVIMRQSGRPRNLILDPAKSPAVILEGSLPGEPKPGDQDIAASEVARPPEACRKKAEPVGEKLIGDVQAQGFRATDAPGYETIVWVDPEDAAYPCRSTSPARSATRHSTSTISDIQLDPALDDSLFSLEPPQGYTAPEAEPRRAGTTRMTATPEAAIDELLRIYAEKSGGALPEADRRLGLRRGIQGQAPKTNPPTAAMRIANLVGRAQSSCSSSRETTATSPTASSWATPTRSSSGTSPRARRPTGPSSATFMSPT